MIPAPSIRKDCCGARSLGHQGWVQSLSFSPLGAPSCCASVDRAGQLRVHSVHGPHGLTPSGEAFNDGADLSQLTAVCWCGPDYVCFGGANGLLRIRHISDATLGYTTPRRIGHTGPVLSVASTGARGHLVLSGGADGRIRLWDPRGRWGLERAAATVSAGYHAVRALAATQGGTDYTTLVAADGGPSGSLHVYDTRRPRGLFEDVQQLGSSSNNLPRADPRWRGFTHAPEGNAVAALQGHRSLARCVCMSTSGDVVASGSDDKTVRFWDLARPANVAEDEEAGHPSYYYGDNDDDGAGSGLFSGYGSGSGYGGGYGSSNNDGGDSHSAAYNSRFSAQSGAGGGGGTSWVEEGSGSFGSVGGTWERLHPSQASRGGKRGVYPEGRGQGGGGGWGGGLQGNGSGLGVWSGVGGCREVVSQQLLLPHSVLSVSCDPEGRAVVATDLKGGVFCSVQVNYVSKSSKVDDHENNSEMKSEEEEPCDSPDGDDDIGNGHKRDDNRSTDTRQSEVNSGAGVDNESHLDGGSLFTESGGGRRAAKLGMLAGRPLCAAVSHDGYYGVVGADRSDDCALRLFDLRLVMTATELKRDGFEAPALRTAGLECSQLRSAGFSAEQCLLAGYSLKELGVFGSRVLLESFPEWDIPELKEAGFDNPRELKELGYSATQLKAHAFQPRELVGAGYSVQELTQAGIKGKQLQALGISMDETLNAAWQQGREAYFHELVQTVLDWDYATDAAVQAMHEQIKAGTHAEAYYAHMWETRLSLTECRVTWIPPHQELVSTEHDLSNTQDRIEEQKHSRDHDSAASASSSSSSGHHHHAAPAASAAAVGRKLHGHYVWQDETNPALVALRDALLEKEALAAAELEEVKSEAEHLLHGASTSTEWSQSQAAHAQQEYAAREAAAAHLAAAEAAVEAAEMAGGGEQVWVREEAALRAKEEAEEAAVAMARGKDERSSTSGDEKAEGRGVESDDAEEGSQPILMSQQHQQPDGPASLAQITPNDEKSSMPLVAESSSFVDAASESPRRSSSNGPLPDSDIEASVHPGNASIPPPAKGGLSAGTSASKRLLKAGGRTAKL